MDAMDNILEQIYHMFMQKMTDLEMGNMLNDNNIISTKEQKQIIEYYGN